MAVSLPNIKKSIFFGHMWHPNGKKWPEGCSLLRIQHGAERPVILGAERPATWGGTTHYMGRIDPGRIDHGADQPAPTV